MSILINKNSKIIVQGFTGKEGSFHAKQCIEYGSNIVGGVTPGKGGNTHLDRPVFNTVKQAVLSTKADVSILFVPPIFLADAIVEAAHGGIKLAIVITEGAPVQDIKRAKMEASKHGMKIIGPNCPGVITPDECKVGIMPGFVFKKGEVGLISKSGTLTYEAAFQVSNSGYGISTAVGIGGDPIIGMNYIELLDMFQKDDQTKCIVIVGEIGGLLEIKAAKHIKDNINKPIIAFISGQSAPEGKRMGHAGAIVSGGKGSAQDKMDALEDAGAYVVHSPDLIGEQVVKVLQKLN